jgi:hypothetical protein
LALLCLILPLCSAYAAAPGTTALGFNTAQAGAVWSAALAFIAPRTLEPLGIPRMAVWGLSGITALDPDLTVQDQSGKLLLYGPNRVIFATTTPTPTDAGAWGVGGGGGGGAAAAGPPVDCEYFPVSAASGRGVDGLVDAIVARLPEGPRYYPEGMVSDVDEASWVADLVREQLLARVADELPHSIACRVTEWEWPRVRCEILVERDSQKGIVIGRGGSILKEVGTEVRAQLPAGMFLELFVRVEKRWQDRDDALDRLGL